MTKYEACIGVYVRTYAKFEVEADGDDKAIEAAIEKFKEDGGDIAWEDTDWSNLCRPSIVSLDKQETGESVTQGHGFAFTNQDWIDRASEQMKMALESCIVQMEQCERMFREDEEFIAALSKARAAIAKAKGA